jgi:hypothetical protein
MPDTLASVAHRDAARRDLPPQVFAATIRSTPATIADPVDVSLDRQPGYRRGPCHGWAPRYAITAADEDTPIQVDEVFPQPGDPCVVARCDDGSHTIVNWRPANG